MTIYGLSEELASRCIECDLAEPESLTSLGGSEPGVFDGSLSSRDGFRFISIRIGVISLVMEVGRLFMHKGAVISIQTATYSI